MKKFLVVLPLLLAGCAGQLQTFTENDVKSAIAVAVAGGDTAAVPCLSSIDAIVSAATVPGVLTKFELFRSAQALAEGPCSPVFAGLTLHLLNKIPGTP